jgi:hypothetical protein
VLELWVAFLCKTQATEAGQELTAKIWHRPKSFNHVGWADVAGDRNLMDKRLGFFKWLYAFFRKGR